MKRQNFMYVGPSIPPLGLKKFTLYNSEELPVKLGEIAKKKPAVRALFVPTKDLAEVRRQLNTKGSLAYTANIELLAIARGNVSAFQMSETNEKEK
jgi:hypothetical protein